jgi:hypothetical protein
MSIKSETTRTRSTYVNSAPGAARLACRRHCFLKLIKISLFTTVCILLSSKVNARINILEPWHPGQDSSIAQPDTYQAIVEARSGERFFEVPCQLDYVAAPQLEVGGRWGIISVPGATGIDDLQIGAKYQFLDGGGERPAVIGEAAVSLPTADNTRDLGTGAVGAWFHWALEKKIGDKVGYFGIGLNINSENSDKLRLGDVFYYHIGASMPYKGNYRLHAELKGFNHGASQLNSVSQQDEYQELYLAPGINYFWKKKTVISGSLLIGLTPKSNNIGILISYQ